MSLFEDPLYRWRETYFVLFAAADRPTAEQVLCVLGLSGLGELIVAVSSSLLLLGRWVWRPERR